LITVIGTQLTIQMRPFRMMMVAARLAAAEVATTGIDSEV
jgi:hypothetical protein